MNNRIPPHAEFTMFDEVTTSIISSGSVSQITSTSSTFSPEPDTVIHKTNLEPLIDIMRSEIKTIEKPDDLTKSIETDTIYTDDSSITTSSLASSESNSSDFDMVSKTTTDTTDNTDNNASDIHEIEIAETMMSIACLSRISYGTMIEVFGIVTLYDTDQNTFVIQDPQEYDFMYSNRRNGLKALEVVSERDLTKKVDIGDVIIVRGRYVQAGKLNSSNYASSNYASSNYPLLSISSDQNFDIMAFAADTEYTSNDVIVTSAKQTKCSYMVGDRLQSVVLSNVPLTTHDDLVTTTNCYEELSGESVRLKRCIAVSPLINHSFYVLVDDHKNNMPWSDRSNRTTNGGILEPENGIGGDYCYPNLIEVRTDFVGRHFISTGTVFTNDLVGMFLPRSTETGSPYRLYLRSLSEDDYYVPNTDIDFYKSMHFETPEIKIEKIWTSESGDDELYPVSLSRITFTSIDPFDNITLRNAIKSCEFPDIITYTIDIAHRNKWNQIDEEQTECNEKFIQSVIEITMFDMKDGDDDYYVHRHTVIGTTMMGFLVKMANPGVLRIHDIIDVSAAIAEMKKVSNTDAFDNPEDIDSVTQDLPTIAVQIDIDNSSLILINSLVTKESQYFASNMYYLMEFFDYAEANVNAIPILSIDMSFDPIDSTSITEINVTIVDSIDKSKSGVIAPNEGNYNCINRGISYDTHTMVSVENLNVVSHEYAKIWADIPSFSNSEIITYPVSRNNPVNFYFCVE